MRTLIMVESPAKTSEKMSRVSMNHSGPAPIRWQAWGDLRPGQRFPSKRSSCQGGA